MDVLLLDNPVIMTIKGLQVESYEGEEVLTEYITQHLMPFKDVGECAVTNGKVHLTKENLALSNT